MARGTVSAAAHGCQFLGSSFVLYAFVRSATRQKVFTFNIFPSRMGVSITELFSHRQTKGTEGRAGQTRISMLIRFAAGFRRQAPRQGVIEGNIQPTSNAGVSNIRATGLLVPIIQRRFAIVTMVLTTHPLRLLGARNRTPTLDNDLWRTGPFEGSFFTGPISQSHDGARHFRR